MVNRLTVVKNVPFFIFFFAKKSLMIYNSNKQGLFPNIKKLITRGRKMKKILTVLCALTIAAALFTGCSKKPAAKAAPTKINLWSFTD